MVKCQGVMLKMLQKPTYNYDLIHQDYEYVLKKLDIKEKDFLEYLNSDRVDQTFYKYDQGFKKRYKYLWKLGSKIFKK